MIFRALEGPLPILHGLEILDESASGLGDLSEEDARRYYDMFKDRKPEDGFLSGEHSRHFRPLAPTKISRLQLKRLKNGWLICG